MESLPEPVTRHAARLFWDVDLAELDPKRHEDFILGRVLSDGDWETVLSVRQALGDEHLRQFVLRAPRRLDERSRRFFQVVFSLGDPPCTTTLFPRHSDALFTP